MKKKLGDLERIAKMDVLKGISGLASDAMSNKLKDGLKKVTVASNSPEGLEKGLDKAKEMISEHGMSEKDPEKMNDSEEKESECMEDKGSELESESEMSEDDSMENLSEEEIDAKLAKLMEMKKKLASK